MGGIHEAAETNGSGNSSHERNVINYPDVVMTCFNWNPLHVAASSGDIDRFKMLLDSNPELVEALDSQQRSLLHLASANGRVEIVRELIEARPEMCLARDRNGASPLHVAAMRGKLDVLDALFEANIPLAEREALLHFCIKHKKLELLEKLLDKYYKNEEEFVDAKDACGNTILHLVAANGYVEIAEKLMEVRPEMCFARDLEGANPLHVAAKRRKHEVLEVMFKANPLAARARVEKGERDTILHLCVKYNSPECLKRLLDKFKEDEFINAQDDAGNTILHLAVASRSVEIISLVLGHDKIDVDARNECKQTAMDIQILQEAQVKKQEVEKGCIAGLLHKFQPKTNKERIQLWLQSHPNEPVTAPERANGYIREILHKFHAKGHKDAINPQWLAEKRTALIIVAVLMATIAFQAGVTPPGGVWPDTSDGHIAGEAVMAYNYPNLYRYYIRTDSIGFVASLSTILLLISDLPFKDRRYVWLLVLIMCLTFTSMALTYAFAFTVITPEWKRAALSHTVVVAVVVWCCVVAIVLLFVAMRWIACSLGYYKIGRKNAMKMINNQSGTGPKSRDPASVNEAKIDVP